MDYTDDENVLPGGGSAAPAPDQGFSCNVPGDCNDRLYQAFIRDNCHAITRNDFTQYITEHHSGNDKPDIVMTRGDLEVAGGKDCNAVYLAPHESDAVMVVMPGLPVRDVHCNTISIAMVLGLLQLAHLDVLEIFKVSRAGKDVLLYRALDGGGVPIYWGNVTELVP